jgi:hypothetical protein
MAPPNDINLRINLRIPFDAGRYLGTIASVLLISLLLGGEPIAGGEMSRNPAKEPKRDREEPNGRNHIRVRPAKGVCCFASGGGTLGERTLR